MVCCTALAALLALFTRFMMVNRPNPLAWRHAARVAEEKTTRRAGGRLRSIAFAVDGLGFLLRHEPNMRLHLGAALVVTAAGIRLGLSMTEWQWIILAIALVLMTEALNTAVEQTCNAVSREFLPAIKAAKDVAAGAVLISAAAAALIGAFVFVPHVMAIAAGPSATYCLGID
jgi:diacylglycerol kinase